jgi:hypothetical protein
MLGGRTEILNKERTVYSSLIGLVKWTGGSILPLFLTVWTML